MSFISTTVHAVALPTSQGGVYRDLHQNQKLQNRVYKSLILNYVCFRNTWVLVKAQVLSLPPKTLIHEVQDWV